MQRKNKLRWIYLTPMGNFTKIFLACFLAFGCTGEYQAKIDGIWIPQADSIQELPKGEYLKIDSEGNHGTMPSSKNVLLVAPRNVSWKRIQSIKKSVEDAQQTPFLIVGKRRALGVFSPSDSPSDSKEDKQISAYVEPRGKFCVGPPNAREYKCTQRSDKLHADRAGIRQLVREARKGYRLNSLELQVNPDIEYADYIRAVDGARTCCTKLPDTKVIVSLKSTASNL